MSAKYNSTRYTQGGLAPWFVLDAPLPPDPRFAGPAVERTAGAMGYMTYDVRGSEVTRYVHDTCYRGMIRYESTLYDVASSTHSTDAGDVMICTTPSQEGDVQPEFVRLEDVLFGACAAFLRTALVGVVVPGACAVYGSVGEIISDAVRVGGDNIFAVDSGGNVDVGGGKMTVAAASGNTTVAGSLAVGESLVVTGATTCSSTLSVTGETTLLSNLHAMGEVRANQFIALSDKRLKQNICQMQGSDALDVVGRLRPCTYEMRSDPDAGRAGLLAQEVMLVLPDCVRAHPGAPPTAEGETATLGVNYIDILAYLVGAVNELSSRLEESQAGTPVMSSDEGCTSVAVPGGSPDAVDASKRHM